MATQTITKKRKSIGESVAVPKKVKTAKAGEKSADKPTPLKSALKKTNKVEAAEAIATSKTAKTPGKATKKSTKVVEVVEEPTPIIEDVEEGGADLTEDQTDALLAGFSSSDEEEDGDEEKDAIPVAKIPAAPTTGLIQKRIRQAVAKQDNPETTPGVIYMGRIPHGFYEKQLRAYLTQFGEIINLRLARNKKTGKSQHWGFIEFASGVVAEIVAKTMDKYLLFGHILQVRRVPREQVKENMFRDGNKRPRRPIPKNKIEGGALKRGMVREGWEKRIDRENARRAAKSEKLKELGYEFEMPAVADVSDVPVKPKQIEPAPEVVEEKPTEAIVEEVVEAVQETPDAVEVTEVKKTKKRASTDGKMKKAKRIKA